MATSLNPRGQLDAELRHRYLKLCNRYGTSAVRPIDTELVDAYARVVDGAATRGSGAILAAVQSAGESYEFIVGRWCDPSWREMVGIALEKGLRLEEPVPLVADRATVGQHRSAGFYWKDLLLEA